MVIPTAIGWTCIFRIIFQYSRPEHSVHYARVSWWTIFLLRGTDRNRTYIFGSSIRRIDLLCYCSFCKPDWNWTHTPRNQNLVRWSLHYRSVGTPPKIRTWTLRILSPLPLPIGLVEYCTGRETRTLSVLILNQARLPFSPPLLFVEVLIPIISGEPRTPVLKARYPTNWVIPHFVLHKGIEPLSSDRKSDALATMLMEQKIEVPTGIEPVTSQETVGHSSQWVMVLRYVCMRLNHNLMFLETWILPLHFRRLVGVVAPTNRGNLLSQRQRILTHSFLFL